MGSSFLFRHSRFSFLARPSPAPSGFVFYIHFTQLTLHATFSITTRRSVEVMSSRLKSLGFGSKRKSAVNIQTNSASPVNPVNPSNASTNSTTASTPPPPNSSSQTSLPMNSQQLGRPPSYSYNSATGRPQSPMPPGQQQQMAHHPAPIDTRQSYMGGQHPQQQMGPPQPPGYGGAYNQMQQPAQGMQYMPQHAAGRPAEVAGDTNRSKAQLIVGIDFVSQPSSLNIRSQKS